MAGKKKSKGEKKSKGPTKPDWMSEEAFQLTQNIPDLCQNLRGACGLATIPMTVSRSQACLLLFQVAVATPSKREEMVNNGAVGQAMALLGAGDVKDRASSIGLLHMLVSPTHNTLFEQAREQLLSVKAAPPHAPVNVLPILWSCLCGESNSGEQSACGIFKNLCDSKSTQKARDSVIKLMQTGNELVNVIKEGRSLRARSDAVATVGMCLSTGGADASSDELKKKLGRLRCMDAVMSLLSEEDVLKDKENSAEVLVNAAQCLEQLTSVKENKIRMLNSGGIDVLSSVLQRRGLPLEAISHTAGTLHSLMLPLEGDIRDDEMDERLMKITRCGAIPQLLRICSGDTGAAGDAKGGAGSGGKKPKGKKKGKKKDPPLPPGMAEAQRSATGCLRQLSLLKSNKILIAEAGGIRHIVPLLEAKDEQTRANANGLLLSLGMEPGNREIMRASKVPDYICGICNYVGTAALDNAFEHDMNVMI